MANLLGLGWLKRYYRVFLWVLGISLIPPASLLSLSYYQAIATANLQLHQASEEGAQQFSSLFRAAEITLTELHVYLENTDTEATDAWRWLQRIAYNDPRFREVGIVNQDGFLAATSMGPVVPPVFIAPQTRANLNRKELQVVGPVTTIVMQERSLVFVLPTQAQGELNILVDPILLNNFWLSSNELDLGGDGFVAYVNRQNNKIIAGVGLVPRNGEKLLSSPPRNRLRASYDMADFDIVVVSEVSKSWALRYWYQRLAAIVPVVTVSSLLMLLVLRRLLYAAQLLDHDIRIGLKDREFEIYYQPILDIRTQKCVGCEALIRWNHACQGMIMPGVFIPIAEKTGLIVELGIWALKAVLSECADLSQRFPGLYMSVNLSPVQLRSDNNFKEIMALLKRHETEARSLVFEITETAFIQGDQREIQKAIPQLRRLGVKVALDDFGTGYSGIQYLSSMDFDCLKIDRIFVAASGKNSNMTRVLDGVIDLGKRFNMKLIAEGIENETQRQVLVDKGIQYGQGWLFAQPMPLNEFKQFLTENLRPR